MTTTTTPPLLRPPSRSVGPISRSGGRPDQQNDEVALRLVLGLLLGLPVVVVTVVPALQLPNWQWLSLTLAAPVVTWGSWPFHRGAARALGRAEVDDELLLSLAIMAASLWSLAGLVAGDPAAGQTYLAAAVALTLCGLLGRAMAPVASPQGGLLVVGAVTTAAAAAAVGFWLTADDDPLQAGLAVATTLFLACPAGWGLATSLPAAIGLRRARRLGASPERPELLVGGPRVDCLVFRAAGTLTLGWPTLAEVQAVGDDIDDEEALHLVGSLGLRSANPLLRAIGQAAFDRGIALHAVDVVADSWGLGVRGVVDGRTVVAGSDWRGSDWASEVPARFVNATPPDQTVVAACWDGKLRAVLAVADPLRPGIAEAVDRLKLLHVEPLLLAGADQEQALALARAVGVEEVVAGVPPSQTDAALGRLRAAGRSVALLADLGVAEGDEPGGSACWGSGLWTGVDMLRLCRTTRRVCAQNRVLAVLPTLVALPLAVGGRLDPVAAVAVVAASAGSVALNSARLLHFRRKRPPAHHRAR